MTTGFNVQDNIPAMIPSEMLSMTYENLRDRCNEVINCSGIDFEESKFAIVYPENCNVDIVTDSKLLPYISCSGKGGSNGGYYVYIYISDKNSMKPVLYCKGWTWQNMIAIRGILTSFFRKC